MTLNHDREGIETDARTDSFAQWVRLFGHLPSPRTAPRLMERIIAYEVQVREEGGLSSALRRRLSDLATGRPSAKILSPGSQLIREWNGEQHVIDVEEGGYRWKGQAFASLSSVAQAITGAKWSGPRFFRLLK